MENTMTRLKLFGIDNCPHFADTTLKNLNSINQSELSKFIVQDEKHESASINVFKVVGTKHPNYAGGTWLDLLENGRRMDHNLKRFIENPGYYLENRTKEPYMHYVSFDGDEIYIGEEGNHRTCIARLFFHSEGSTILHGVRLETFTIDWAFKNLFDNISAFITTRKLSIYLSLQNKIVERKDAANWKMDTYQILVKVRRSSKVYELNYTDLQDLFQNLQKPLWKRIVQPWRSNTKLLPEEAALPSGNR